MFYGKIDEYGQQERPLRCIRQADIHEFKCPEIRNSSHHTIGKGDKTKCYHTINIIGIILTAFAAELIFKSSFAAG